MANRAYCLVLPVILGGLLLKLWEPQAVSDSLKVRMNEKTQIVSFNANVIINCELYDFHLLPLEINGIEVRWFHRRTNSANEVKVFEYYGGKQTSFRSGASISISGLRMGDASLFLPLIQLQEGGEYRCEVIISPNRAQATSRLEVEAQPSSILLPQEVVVQEKKVFTLECIVAGFYPEPVQIIWKKVISGTHSLIVDNSEAINISSNNDGTFNATSHLILQPLLEDNGTIYQCVVVHKSLLTPLQSSTTLIVTELVKSTDVEKTIMYVLLIVMVLGFCVWFFVEPFAKGNTQVTALCRWSKDWWRQGLRQHQALRLQQRQLSRVVRRLFGSNLRHRVQ
ncbi:natural cytotoxicity triggering receptor 3 ligand 1-like [Macrotis lagotis]|uniref:natural cytotoxicity triggering receptor 3 ligand 1-like n=1 Tax=Macrotis lagotis TaxID=92651 RepID=UPI003D68B379